MSLTLEERRVCVGCGRAAVCLADGWKVGYDVDCGVAYLRYKEVVCKRCEKPGQCAGPGSVVRFSVVPHQNGTLWVRCTPHDMNRWPTESVAVHVIGRIWQGLW